MDKEKFLASLKDQLEKSEKLAFGFESDHEAGMSDGKESLLYELIYQIERGEFDN